MAALASQLTAVFDVLLAPLGHDFPGIDLFLWPALMGLLALPVYKALSNQRAIAAAKRRIAMHLLEVRLFQGDLARVLRATGRIIAKNGAYLAHNLVPVAVLIGPMLAVMTQLVAHYAYAPSPVGSVQVLRAELAPGAGRAQLELPQGVELEAPMVQTAGGQAFWRLRATDAGDHVLTLRIGDAAFTKRWAVGGEARKVPVRRVQGLQAFLYPGEEPLPDAAPVRAIALPVASRPLAFFPDGEVGVLSWATMLSLVVGFACRGVFGVVL